MTEEVKIIYFEKIDSTNAKAKEMVDIYYPWTVIIAREQHFGHGTKGKSWFSPVGGIYFSVILPSANIRDLQILTMLSAFAVATAIKEEFSLEPMIKLPNDVFLDGKKFCGILTENVIRGRKINSVIGIGINTNIDQFPDELSETAISISKLIGRSIDNEKIIRRVVQNIKFYLNEIIN